MGANCDASTERRLTLGCVGGGGCEIGGRGATRDGERGVGIG